MKTKKLQELEEKHIITVEELRGEIVRAEETYDGLILVFSDGRFANIEAEPDYDYAKLVLHRFPDLHELREADLITPEDIKEQKRLEEKEREEEAERRKAAKLAEALAIVKLHEEGKL